MFGQDIDTLDGSREPRPVFRSGDSFYDDEPGHAHGGTVRPRPRRADASCGARPSSPESPFGTGPGLPSHLAPPPARSSAICASSSASDPSAWRVEVDARGGVVTAQALHHLHVAGRAVCRHCTRSAARRHEQRAPGLVLFDSNGQSTMAPVVRGHDRGHGAPRDRTELAIGRCPKQPRVGPTIRIGPPTSQHLTMTMCVAGRTSFRRRARYRGPARSFPITATPPLPTEAAGRSRQWFSTMARMSEVSRFLSVRVAQGTPTLTAAYSEGRQFLGPKGDQAPSASPAGDDARVDVLIVAYSGSSDHRSDPGRRTLRTDHPDNTWDVSRWLRQGLSSLRCGRQPPTTAVGSIRVRRCSIASGSMGRTRHNLMRSEPTLCRRLADRRRRSAHGAGEPTTARVEVRTGRITRCHSRPG